MTSRTFSSRRVCINTFPCVMAALWAIVSVSVCDAAALSVRASSTRVQLHSGMLPLADAVITEALRAMREKDTVASADSFPSPMYVGSSTHHFKNACSSTVFSRNSVSHFCVHTHQSRSTPSIPRTTMCSHASAVASWRHLVVMNSSLVELLNELSYTRTSTFRVYDAREFYASSFCSHKLSTTVLPAASVHMHAFCRRFQITLTCSPRLPFLACGRVNSIV